MIEQGHDALTNALYKIEYEKAKIGEERAQYRHKIHLAHHRKACYT